RQPARVRAHRAPARAPQADPGAEGRNDARRHSGGGIPHGRARRLRRRGRRALRGCGRDPGPDARRADRRCVASLRAARAARAGRRVAVVTNAGGLGILAADACEALGLELPPPSEDARAALAAVMPAEGSAANPIDLLGGANAESFERALPPVLADPAFDAAI